MTKKFYLDHKDLFFANQSARLLDDVQNGQMKIPAGTIVTITRKYKGFTIMGEPCKCCGISPIMTRVGYFQLSLINQPQEA